MPLVNPALHSRPSNFPTSPSRINVNTIREEIAKRRQPEIDNLVRMCNDYLDNIIPQQNTVSIDEFMPYFKLFSREKLSAMTKDEIQTLSYSYSQRFCAQEPIVIIDPLTTDDNGRLWRGDNRKHKVLLELPPRIKRLDTVNVLGRQAGTIATECLANSRSTGNPLENKTSYYSNALAQLVELAQKKTGSSDMQDKKFLEYERKLLHKEEPKAEPSQPQQEQTDQGSSEYDPSSFEADWS